MDWWQNEIYEQYSSGDSKFQRYRRELELFFHTYVFGDILTLFRFCNVVVLNEHRKAIDVEPYLRMELWNQFLPMKEEK